MKYTLYSYLLLIKIFLFKQRFICKFQTHIIKSIKATYLF